MKIETKVYRREDLGPEADMEDIVHYIETPKDLEEIIKEVLKRQIDGWDTKFTRMTGMDVYFIGETLGIEFRRGEEWRYLKVRLKVK